MFKGFYNLTSAMLTQGRMLEIVSNNMGNVSTTGFKTDRYTASTFEEVMWTRTGNRSKSYAELGQMSWITAPDQSYTDYSSGSFDETGLTLDFAVNGTGYFAVETEDGRAYTRDGSFSLDNEGYLCLPGQGRVLDTNGDAIALTTDRITADNAGRLFTEEGAYLGRIGVYAFENEQEQLEKNEQGLFTTEAQPEQSQNYRILHKFLERSNVDWVKQMTEMIAAERAYQSAAEVIKMYDNMMNRATTEIGRMS